MIKLSKEEQKTCCYYYYLEKIKDKKKLRR